MPQSTAQLPRTASWVVKEVSTGRVVLETFSARVVSALNRDRYKAVPIREHLAELNASIREEARHQMLPAEEAAEQVGPAVVAGACTHHNSDDDDCVPVAYERPRI